MSKQEFVLVRANGNRAGYKYGQFYEVDKNQRLVAALIENGTLAVADDEYEVVDEATSDTQVLTDDDLLNATYTDSDDDAIIKDSTVDEDDDILDPIEALED